MERQSFFRGVKAPFASTGNFTTKFSQRHNFLVCLCRPSHSNCVW